MSSYIAAWLLGAAWAVALQVWRPSTPKADLTAAAIIALIGVYFLAAA